MSRLSALSPFGPIFAKELRVSARRKRTYFLRVFYLAALLLALLLAYTSTQQSFYGSGSGIAAQMQQQAELGLDFFMGFAVFCLVAMCAICPILTCTAISAERLGKTLPVLLMTPISGWQIISGKLFSRLLVALTLIGLSLPVLALVRLLGGVELSQMVGVVCLCTCVAISTASLGLFFSTFLNRSYVVILLSFGVILLGYVFVPMIALMLSTVRVGAPRNLDLIATVSPFIALITVNEPAFLMSGSWTTTCLGACLLQLGWAAVLLVLSALVLRRTIRRAGEPAARAAAVADLAAAPSASHSAATIRKPRRPRDVSDNPIAWREVRRPLMDKAWQRIVGAIIVVCGLAATYVALAVNNSLGDWGSQVGYAFILNGLVWLVVSVLSATAIAQEKESDTWTLLLATPLSGWQIVWGKVLGLLRRMMWPMALIAAHFLIFGFGPLGLISAVLVLWIIVTFNTVWVAIGLYLSLRFGKPTFAVIATLLVAVVAYLGVLTVLGIIGNLSRHYNLPEAVGWYAPYGYLDSAIEGYHRGEFFLPTSDVRESVFLEAVLMVGLLHVAVAGAILGATARRFDRIVRRAAQRRPAPRGFEVRPLQPTAAS